MPDISVKKYENIWNTDRLVRRVGKNSVVLMFLFRYKSSVLDRDLERISRHRNRNVIALKMPF